MLHVEWSGFAHRLNLGSERERGTSDDSLVTDSTLMSFFKMKNMGKEQTGWKEGVKTRVLFYMCHIRDV